MAGTSSVRAGFQRSPLSSLRFWLRRQLGYVNVKDFGALANGIHNDTPNIQAAIDYLGTNGGEVYFPAGEYKTTVPIRIENDGITLRGAGVGQPFDFAPSTNGGSLLVPTSTFTGDCVIKVQRPGSAMALAGVTVRGLSIWGYSVPAGVDGIYWECNKGRIEDVWMSQLSRYGVQLKTTQDVTGFEDAYDNELIGVRVDNMGLDNTVRGTNSSAAGFYFANRASDNFMLNCWVFNSAGDGLYFENRASANLIDSCYIYSCAGKGINSQTTHEQKFRDIRIQDCNGGIYLVNSAGATGGFQITGCTLRNCSKTTDNTTDSININPSGQQIIGAVIDGNIFSSNSGFDNGGVSPNKNRARYHINIAHANATQVQLGVNSFGYDVTKAQSSAGTANVIDSGTSTLTTPRVLARGSSPLAHTGDVIESTLASITVPKHLMGLTGRLRITTIWSRNAGGVAACTPKITFGGTSYLSSSLSTVNVSAVFLTQVANRAALNSQIGGATGGLINTSANSVVTSAIDTSADVTLAITGTLGNNADTITLESYLVEVL